MYNLLAWLVGSSSRGCESCGRIHLKHTMLHPTYGVWFCNHACENEDLSARAW